MFSVSAAVKTDVDLLQPGMEWEACARVSVHRFTAPIRVGEEVTCGRLGTNSRFAVQVATRVEEGEASDATIRRDVLRLPDR